METKSISNRFKMLKLVHKSKPNKFHGGKLTCGGRVSQRNVEETLRTRGTMAVCVGNLQYNAVRRQFYA